MMRVWRTQLRRSTALPLALAILVIGAVALHAAPGAWTGRWTALAVAVREYLFILVPLALAVGAWQSRREQRANLAELFETTARPRWQRITPTAAAVAAGAIAGLAVAFAAAAVRVASTASYFNPAVVAVLAVGALALVTAAWLGMAIGRLLPSPVTAPVLAVLGLLALVILPYAVLDGDSPVTLLSPVLPHGEADVAMVAGKVTAAQGLWLAALAVTGFGILAARHRRTQAVAVLPAVLGAAVAIPILPSGGAFTPDPGAAALVCAEGTPRVCVAQVHARLLPDVVPPAREALRMLGRLPDPPTAAVEDTDPESPQPVDTVLFDVLLDRTGGVGPPDELRSRMLEGAGTRLCQDLADEAFTWQATARALAEAWLTGTPPAGNRFWAGDDELLMAAWQGLAALPEDAQRARIGELRQAFLACDGDAIGQTLASLR